MPTPSHKFGVPLHIGFTGTRFGMTPSQRANVEMLVAELAKTSAFIFRAHHGDCVGADAEFHAIVRTHAIGFLIGHPGPDGDTHRAHCVFDEMRAPKKHIPRNQNIVHESTHMIAAPYFDLPDGDEEVTFPVHGGTFRTIAMARRAGRPLAIAFRSGDLWKERWL